MHCSNLNWPGAHLFEWPGRKFNSKFLGKNFHKNNSNLSGAQLIECQDMSQNS